MTLRTYTIPAPVTTRRVTPASIVVRRYADGSAAATAPATVEYVQLRGQIDARFNGHVERIIGRDGGTVHVNAPASAKASEAIP